MTPLSTILKDRRVKYFLAVLTASFVLFFACSRRHDVEPNQTYTGEELFKGVILQDGEVATKLPLINKFSVKEASYSDDQYRAIVQFEDKVLDKIKEIDPEFFIQFQQKLQSGEEHRILQAIEHGQEIFIKAVQNVPEYAEALEKGRSLVAQVNLESVTKKDGSIDQNKLSQELQRLGVDELRDKSTLPEALCITWAGAVYVVIFVEVAVISNIVGAIAGYLYGALYGPALESATSVAGGENVLMKEMLVKQVARNLSLQ